MQTAIAPICENKNLDISDAGSYRPISLATTISKWFERNILFRISAFLATTDNQFVSKTQHGTGISKDIPVSSAF